MKGCNLSRASFHGAEIEQTMFSPDQIRDADFGGPAEDAPTFTIDVGFQG